MVYNKILAKFISKKRFKFYFFVYRYACFFNLFQGRLLKEEKDNKNVVVRVADAARKLKHLSKQITN